MPVIRCAKACHCAHLLQSKYNMPERNSPTETVSRRKYGISIRDQVLTAPPRFFDIESPRAVEGLCRHHFAEWSHAESPGGIWQTEQFLPRLPNGPRPKPAAAAAASAASAAAAEAVHTIIRIGITKPNIDSSGVVFGDHDCSRQSEAWRGCRNNGVERHGTGQGRDEKNQNYNHSASESESSHPHFDFYFCRRHHDCTLRPVVHSITFIVTVIVIIISRSRPRFSSPYSQREKSTSYQLLKTEP